MLIKFTTQLKVMAEHERPYYVSHYTYLLMIHQTRKFTRNGTLAVSFDVI